MKNIKKFESFISEELSPETYLSAADKLKKAGHRNRADKLTGYVDELAKKIESIELDFNGEKFVIDTDNIYINRDGNKGDGTIDFYVYMDKGIANANRNRKEDDWAADFRYLWDEKITSDEKKSFVEEYNMPKGMIVKSYDDLSDDEHNGFNEYAEMNDHLLMLHFATYDKNVDELERDGLIIPDRRNANKLLKLLKEFGKTKGGKLNDLIQKLTVNDLYYD